MPHISLINHTTILDSGVFPSRVSDQITAATSPAIGDVEAIVMADGGSDEGFKFSIALPDDYSSAPVVRITGLLDGAPGASDVLGFGVRKRASADNEAGDATFDAEQTASATIGSSGSAHSDEDIYQEEISLTAGDYSAGDQISGYLYIDASTTTYTGNFLLLAADFIYTAA